MGLLLEERICFQGSRFFSLNKFFPEKSLLLKERSCFSESKFFPLRVDFSLVLGSRHEVVKVISL